MKIERTKKNGRHHQTKTEPEILQKTNPFTYLEYDGPEIIKSQVKGMGQKLKDLKYQRYLRELESYEMGLERAINGINKNMKVKGKAEQKVIDLKLKKYGKMLDLVRGILGKMRD